MANLFLHLQVATFSAFARVEKTTQPQLWLKQREGPNLINSNEQQRRSLEVGKSSWPLGIFDWDVIYISCGLPV